MDHRWITLSRHLCAKVSPDDFDWLSTFKWHALVIKSKTYAATCPPREPGENSRKLYMHRLIMGVSDPNIHIDHIDMNGLNNHRTNLRMATVGENNCNTAKRRGTTSRFKGVSWDSRRAVWTARINHKGRAFFLGYYGNEIEAARVYDLAAKQIHGEFARTNADLGLYR